MWQINEKFGECTIYKDTKNPSMELIKVPKHNFIRENNELRDAKSCEQKLFRVASKTKTSNDNEKEIREIDEMLAEIEELKEFLDLEPDEQLNRLEQSENELEERRLEENEESKPDKDELKKRRLESDFKREYEKPEDNKERLEIESNRQAKYHVLSYHVGSIQKEKGDGFMRKIIEGHKEIENGDSFMQDLGVS